MDHRGEKTCHARFGGYVDELSLALGHADRIKPLRAYCTGLLLPGERKSVEPIAARVEPGRVQAAHQSLHHFVAKSEWSDEALLASVQAQTLPAIERQGPPCAFIVHAAGLRKKGVHSVGVARQYCSQIGRQDNCQIAVSLSIASEHASLPIAYRLYLPEAWANDVKRRAKAGVPDDVVFRTKPEIAIEQLRRALDAGLPRRVVLAGADFGADASFRMELTRRGLTYVVAIPPSLALTPPETGFVPAKTSTGRERPSCLTDQNAEPKLVSAKDLAKTLPAEAWRTVTWREGSNVPLASRFAALRVRPAGHDCRRQGRSPCEWLVVEWSLEEPGPRHCWLSTLPESIAIPELVRYAKLRWRIERDYRELTQEIGLGHFEGRGWRGFHHHAALVIAAYGFLVSERGQSAGSKPALVLKAPYLPADFQPRGAKLARPSELNRQPVPKQVALAAPESEALNLRSKRLGVSLLGHREPQTGFARPR